MNKPKTKKKVIVWRLITIILNSIIGYMIIQWTGVLVALSVASVFYTLDWMVDRKLDEAKGRKEP